LTSLVSEAQSQIQAQNGSIFFWLTTGIVSAWANASQCYSTVTSGSDANDKNYYASGPAPTAFVSEIEFAGTKAFINLKTGVLMGMQSSGNYLTNTQLVTWATEANQ